MVPHGRLPAAVVISLDGVVGIQSARILNARGVPVIGIAEDVRHFCARTRVPSRVIRSKVSGQPLLDTLERLAATLPPPGIAYLVPCNDACVLTLSAAREELPSNYRVVLPDHDVLLRLLDKARFAEHALANGFPIPPTVVLRSNADALRAAESLTFPAVVKPAIKTPLWLEHAQAKALRVETASQFVALYEKASQWSDVLVIQSWIEGGEDSLFSCNAYFDRHGQPLVTFVSRKIRQWPLDVGETCLGEEVRNDAVLEATLRLFGSVPYRGLAYAEIKRDSLTGSYAIVEPNIGRPTGRSAIAERGGVELLFTAYCDALGLPLPLSRTQFYRGVKWIHWRKDLQATAVRMSRGELTVRGWWRSVRGPKTEAIVSLRDPLPFVAELAHVAHTALLTVLRDRGPLRRGRVRRSRRAP